MNSTGFSHTWPEGVALSGAHTLLSNGSTTSKAVQWGGGVGLVNVSGTFGGATVTMQMLGPDNSTWQDLTGVDAFTEGGSAIFELPSAQVRVEVSGGTPSGLYASIRQIGRRYR